MQTNWLKRNSWPLYLLGDIYSITLAYFLTVIFRLQSEWGLTFLRKTYETLGIAERQLGMFNLGVFYYTSAPRIILIISITVCFLYACMDLYAKRRVMHHVFAPWRVVQANAAALVLFFIYFYLSANEYHPRSFFAVFTILNIALTLFMRALTKTFLTRALDSRPELKRRALLICGDKTREPLSYFMEGHGMVIADTILAETTTTIDDLLKVVPERSKRGDIDMVVCSVEQLDTRGLMLLLESITDLGIDVKLNSRELATIQQHAQETTDSFMGAPLIHFNASPSKVYSRFLKKPLAYVVSVFMTLGSLIFIITIPILLRLTSRGPAIYAQKRIGIHQQPFTMYKFRTMTMNADEELSEIENLNESGQGLFKIKQDPRIIPMGRFLRRFSIDEIPQLYNIFKGEMALVGPRPLPQRDFESYSEDWNYHRHKGYPGLTCLWQVSGRSDLGFEEMCILDIYYLHNQNLIMDIKILFRTISVVLFAKGAY